MTRPYGTIHLIVIPSIFSPIVAVAPAVPFPDPYRNLAFSSPIYRG